MTSFINTLLTLLAAVSFYSCTKNSPADPFPTHIGNITVYYPFAHTANIQQFLFYKALLVQYTNETIDTSNTEIDAETRVYTFKYPPTGILPSSVTFVDSAIFGVDTLNSGAPPFVFVFDKNDRLITDSSIIPFASYTSHVNYSYSADSIVFNQDIAGSPDIRIGGIALINGNMAGMSGLNFTYGSTYTYGSTPNPLHNSQIGNTYGPYFLGGIIQAFRNSYGLPVDFISENLPSRAVDATGLVTTFQWTMGPNGQVAGGTATDLYAYALGHGAALITFTYQ